jgi:hypothetical protein
MSMFEWLGEAINPGPVGDFEGRRPGVFRHRVIAIVVALIGWTLMGGWIFCLWRWTGETKIPWFAGSLLGTFFYLLTGYFIMPRPDFSNIGWFGGLIDNPFRISDDWNRWLLFIRIALLPGRLWAMALVNPFLLRAIQAREAQQAEAAEAQLREERQIETDIERFLERPPHRHGQ